MKNLEQFFDIIVVGAGHAGCEASPILFKFLRFDNDESS